MGHAPVLLCYGGTAQKYLRHMKSVLTMSISSKKTRQMLSLNKYKTIISHDCQKVMLWNLLIKTFI